MTTAKVPFATLVAELSHPDRLVRRKAIQQIMRRRKERGQAFQHLAQLLNDPEHYVRKQAVRALGKLGDPRAFPYLDNALKARSWHMRLEVVNALVELGRMPQYSVQAGSSLHPILMNDSAAQVRQAALEGLIAVKGPLTVQELLNALTGTSQELRDYAVRELKRNGGFPFSQVGPALLALTTHSSADARLAALEILQNYRTPEVTDRLIQALRDQNSEVRLWAASGLFNCADWLVSQRDMGAVEPLIATLDDVEFRVRRRVVNALSKLGDPRAIEPLIATLNDTNSFVRWETVSALRHLNDPRTVEPLIARLNDSDTSVRYQTVLALKDLDDPRTVEPLIARLNDVDYSVRRETVLALKDLDDPRTVEPLIARLNDSDTSVRYEAVLALKDLGNPRAVESLIAVLDDADIRVRYQAALALKDLGNPRAVEPLITLLNNADTVVRYQAVLALKDLCDPRAVEPLIARLNDTNEATQYTAIQALRAQGDPRAIEPLRGLLNLNWPPLIREAASDAIAALERLQDPLANEHLL